MSYSREQRAANAAKQASEAGRVLQEAGQAKQEHTDQGVEQPVENPEIARVSLRDEPRRLGMEEIRQRRGEQEAADREEAEPELAPAPKPAAKPAPVPEPQASVTVDPVIPPAEAPVPEPEPVKMVKVKVDGEEFEVPQADVDEAGGITIYQKGRAADNRLAKNNEALAETRRVQQAQAQAMTEWVKAQTPKEPVVTDDEFIASKMDAIRFGTPEESAAAMREVISRANPKVDQNSIIQQAVSTMQRNNAIDNFKKEFQDVVANPMLLRLAASLEAERMQKAGPQTDWGTFFRTIGNEVRSVAGPRQSQPSLPAVVATETGIPSQTSEKEARKASIVNLPTASARAALPEETKPETREESLERMKKSRGILTG